MVVFAAALLVACGGAKQGSGKADSGTTADWDGASLQEVPVDTGPSVIDTDAAAYFNFLGDPATAANNAVSNDTDELTREYAFKLGRGSIRPG